MTWWRRPVEVRRVLDAAGGVRYELPGLALAPGDAVMLTMDRRPTAYVVRRRWAWLDRWWKS